MAVRIPLYNNSGDLQEMSTVMVDQIKNVFRYQFQVGGTNTRSIIQLAVNANNGTIGTISDTRLQAGAYSTNVSSTPSEGTTAEPSVVTVNYNHLQQIIPTTETLDTDTGILYPVYQNAGNIRAMTVEDMRDTFVNPVISEIASSTNTVTQAGTYFLSTSSTAANSEQEVVSATPCFVDTRANIGAYTAGSIPEALDQPSTIQNYYLHRNIMASPTYTPPMFITSAGHVQEYTTATFGAMAKQLMNISTTSIAGKRITYSLGTNTTNYTKGTGMADTRLNGSGNYQTRYVNTNDYRAQEFPNGTPTTINTYYLRLVVS